MSENEIKSLLSDWQMYQHCGEYDEAEAIEDYLWRETGLNMEHDWETILKERGMIQ